MTGALYGISGSILLSEDTIFDAWFLDGAVIPPQAITTIYGGKTYTRFFGLNHQIGNTVTAWVGGLDCGDTTIAAPEGAQWAILKRGFQLTSLDNRRDEVW